MSNEEGIEFFKVIEEAKVKYPDDTDMQQAYITRNFISIVAKDQGLTDKEYIEKHFKRKKS